MKEVQHRAEQTLVSAILHELNGKSSSILDSFSGWMIGGYAATAALLVSQYGSVTNHLAPASIHQFLILFLWSLIVVVFQKIIAVLVASASQSAAVARDMDEKAGTNPNTLNVEFILTELKRPIFWPMKLLVNRSYKKVLNGDLVSAPQNMNRLTQVQGLLCLAQVILVLVAVCKITIAFKA